VSQVVCVLSVLTNLAIGVVVGVGLSSLWHVWTSGRQLRAKATTSTDAQGNAIKVHFSHSIKATIACAIQKCLDPLHFSTPICVHAPPTTHPLPLPSLLFGWQVYNLRGSPLFFGSSRPLLRLFAYESDPEVVVVDVTDVDLSDLSGITALNEVGKRYQVHSRSSPYRDHVKRTWEIVSGCTVIRREGRCGLLVSVGVQEHGCKRVIVRGLDAQGLQLVRRCKGQATHLHIDGMQVRQESGLTEKKHYTNG
jgi:MFS superfamily sulfate permease-like transporter